MQRKATAGGRKRPVQTMRNGLGVSVQRELAIRRIIREQGVAAALDAIESAGEDVTAFSVPTQHQLAPHVRVEETTSMRESVDRDGIRRLVAGIRGNSSTSQ